MYYGRALDKSWERDGKPRSATGDPIKIYCHPSAEQMLHSEFPEFWEEHKAELVPGVIWFRTGEDKNDVNAKAIWDSTMPIFGGTDATVEHFRWEA